MPHRKIFQQWLNNPEITEEDKLEIEKYSDQEKKDWFNYKKFKFGTSGIRKISGYAPQKLNSFTYKLLATGYAKYINQKHKSPSVLVIHDNRKNGSEYALDVASILKDYEIDVYLSPKNILLSSPILSYAIRKLNLSGGINITASHNPYIYNGFKVYDNTGKLISTKEEKEISELFPHISEALDIKSHSSNFKYIDESIIESYFQELKNSLPSISSNKDFPILFSSHHGTSSSITPKLAKDLGFNNFESYAEECNISWKPNKGEVINPEEEDSFKYLMKKAEEKKIKYVCSQDPDADRCALAEQQDDGSWHLFSGNETGILTAWFKSRHTKLKNPYIVISHVTGTFIKKLFPNIPIYATNTGFKNISEIINSEEAKGNNLLIAFEEATGSLIFPIARDKDGYQQIFMFLMMIAETKGNLKKQLQDLYRQFGKWMGFTDFYKVPKSKLEEIKKIKRQDIPFEDLRNITHQRKPRIISWELEKENWIKFRYSGTETKLKVYYNIFGSNLSEIRKKIKKYREFIEAIIEK